MEHENEIGGIEEILESQRLYEQLNTGYDAVRPLYKAMCPKEIVRDKLASIAGMKEVFKRVLAEHREDGDLAAFIVGSVAAKALGANLARHMLDGGMPEFVASLANNAIMPMVASWQEELEREMLEKEICELEQ